MKLNTYKEAEIQHQHDLKKATKIRKAGFLAVGATAVCLSLLALSTKSEIAQLETTVVFSGIAIMLTGCGKYLQELMSGLNPENRPKTSGPILGMPFHYDQLTPYERGVLAQEKLDDKDISIHSIKNIREKFLKAYEPDYEKYKSADVNNLRSRR